MEQLDLYDKNMEPIHKTMIRGGSNSKGEYYIIVHIWIQNNNQQFLIQQRNKASDAIPHQWAVTTGAVVTGETSIQGAIREVYEELGIRLSSNHFQLLAQYFIDDKHANYRTDLYIVKEDILLNDCKIDTVEVRELAYKTMPQIKDMIERNQFWNYERLLARSGYFNLLEKS